ncbi:MAG: hypothetical protein JNM17_12540 [Archangium sp.]|nr:hypothetical protein [Archangium sp.]
MRFALLSLLLAACGTPQLCKPGSCPTGQHCVYVRNEATPSCNPACDVGVDAGTCASGTSCDCAPSCAGCKNCVPVCQ